MWCMKPPSPLLCLLLVSIDSVSSLLWHVREEMGGRAKGIFSIDLSQRVAFLFQYFAVYQFPDFQTSKVSVPKNNSTSCLPNEWFTTFGRQVFFSTKVPKNAIFQNSTRVPWMLYYRHKLQLLYCDKYYCTNQ